MRKKERPAPSGDSQGAGPRDPKKPEKVMVPFFEAEEPGPEPAPKADSIHPSRRHRFSRPEGPPNRSSNSKKEKPRPAPTKEIGLNSAPLRPRPESRPESRPEGRPEPRPSSPPARPRKKFDESYDDVPEKKIAYIDTANVGNIRPLSTVFRATREQPPPDPLADFKRSLRPSFSCQLDGPEPGLSFVDALIRSSNTFDDVVEPEPPAPKADKSQELKSVLTKMGILERPQTPRAPPDPGASGPRAPDTKALERQPPELKALGRELDRRYVFPKYMSSPDPSSLPMPRPL